MYKLYFMICKTFLSVHINLKGKGLIHNNHLTHWRNRDTSQQPLETFGGESKNDTSRYYSMAGLSRVVCHLKTPAKAVEMAFILCYG